VSAVAARVRRAPLAVRSGLPPGAGRRVALVALVLVLLAALYMVVIRNSALVSIDDVHVTGLTSKDSESIRAAIEAEARDMTTLHVRREELMAAVEGFPVVRDIAVSADFPHTLRVHVVEHRPAALVSSGSAEVPVAADGSVLRGLPAAGALPSIDAPGAISADQIRASAMLALLGVAGAAPGPIAARMESLERDEERGVVVTLRDGPELVFGAPTRVADKWRAAARVLADPASQGASYVDVRLPERPVAGGIVDMTPETVAVPETAVEPVAPVPVEPAPTEPQP
jgi:cell division protein FtsQ